jgi:hypothetical protein
MIDMLCTIDDHRPLRNMLVAKAPIDDKLRAEAPINAELTPEAPINAKSRAEAPIDTESRAKALPSRKVDLRLNLRLFHFSFGYPDFFVSLWMAILRPR